MNPRQKDQERDSEREDVPDSWANEQAHAAVAHMDEARLQWICAGSRIDWAPLLMAQRDPARRALAEKWARIDGFDLASVHPRPPPPVQSPKKAEKPLGNRTTEAIQALLKGDVHRYARLHASGADEHAIEHGQGMVHFAARGGSPVAVEFLARMGLDVDARDNRGMTPLMHAVDSGHRRVVEKLLELGADALAVKAKGIGLVEIAKRAVGKSEEELLEMVRVAEVAVERAVLSAESGLVVPSKNNAMRRRL